MSILDQTLGATLLGAVFSTVLYGLALAQVYHFAVAEYKTTTSLKLLVALVGLLDTAHTFLLWGWMYEVVVTNYGNIIAMINVQWSLAACFMAFFTLDGVVQGFFTFRVYAFSGAWWLAVPLWILELAAFAVHTSIVVFAIKSDGILDFEQNYNGLLYASMCLSIATSFGNTILLCWYLRKMDSGFARTRKAVKKLVLLTCETGGLQAAMALVVAVLWFTKPLASYWLAAYTIHAKIYSNSLLATLNSRSRIRDALNEPMSIELPPRISGPPTSAKGGSTLGSIAFEKGVDGAESQSQDVKGIYSGSTL